MKKESSEQQQRVLKKLVRSYRPNLPSSMNAFINRKLEQPHSKQNRNENKSNNEQVYSTVKYDSKSNDDSTESTDSQSEIPKQNTHTSCARTSDSRWVSAQEVGEKSVKKPRKKRVSRTKYRHDNIDYIKPSKQEVLQKSFSCAFKKLVHKSKEIYSKIDEGKNLPEGEEEIDAKQDSTNNSPSTSPRNTMRDMPSLSSPEPEKNNRLQEDLNTKFNKNILNVRTRLLNDIRTNALKQFAQRDENMQHKEQNQIIANANPRNMNNLLANSSQSIPYSYYGCELKQQNTTVQENSEAQMQHSEINNPLSNNRNNVKRNRRIIPRGPPPNYPQNIPDMGINNSGLSPNYYQQISELDRRRIQSGAITNYPQNMPPGPPPNYPQNFSPNMRFRAPPMPCNYPPNLFTRPTFPPYLYPQIPPNIHHQNIPLPNIHHQNISRQNVPQQNIPQQNVPQQNVHQQNVAKQNIPIQNISPRNKDKQLIAARQQYNQQAPHHSLPIVPNANNLFPVFPGVPPNYLLKEKSQLNVHVNSQNSGDAQNYYVNSNRQHEVPKHIDDNEKEPTKPRKIQHISQSQIKKALDNIKFIQLNTPETIEENTETENVTKAEENKNTIPYQIIITHPNSEQIILQNIHMKKNNPAVQNIIPTNQQTSVIQNITHHYQIHQNGQEKQNIITRAVIHSPPEQNNNIIPRKRSASPERNDKSGTKRAHIEILADKIKLLRSIKHDMERGAINYAKNTPNSSIAAEKTQEQMRNKETTGSKTIESVIVPQTSKHRMTNNPSTSYCNEYDRNNIETLEERILRPRNHIDNIIFDENEQQQNQIQNQNKINHSIDSILSRQCSMRKDSTETNSNHLSDNNTNAINSVIITNGSKIYKINNILPSISKTIPTSADDEQLEDLRDQHIQSFVDRISSQQSFVSDRIKKSETQNKNTKKDEKLKPLSEMPELIKIPEKYLRRKKIVEQKTNETEKCCDVLSDKITDTRNSSQQNYASNETVPSTKPSHSDNDNSNISKFQQNSDNLVPLNLSVRKPNNAEGTDKENNEDSRQSNTANNSLNSSNWSVSDLDTSLDDPNNLSYVKTEEEYNGYLQMLQEKKATKPYMFYKFVTGVQKLNNQPMVDLRTFFCLLKKGKLADYKKLFIQVNNNNNTQ